MNLPEESLKHKLKLAWSSVKGEAFICECGWEADVDTRVPLLSNPVTQAAWIGVRVGKVHIRHLAEVEAAEEDAPHRSTCPGCGHPECDAKKDDSPRPPTMRPPMLIALEEIRDILVSGTHKDSGFSPEADALDDIGRAYGIAEGAIADAKKQPSKDASTTR